MIKVRVQVRDNKRAWDEFRARMRKVHGSHVTVGVHPDAGSYSEPGAPTVAEVALWAEFGTKRSPERSFLRSAIDEGQHQIDRWRVELLEQVKDGKMTVEKALEALGFRAQVLVQNKIKSGVPPANAESTLREKRREGVGATTLQWTRLLLRSIGHKVNLK